MADTRITSIISTYQEGISEKPYMPSVAYWCTTLGANALPSKLFSDHDVVQFWKDVGLIPSDDVCSKCRSNVLVCQS